MRLRGARNYGGRGGLHDGDDGLSRSATYPSYCGQIVVMTAPEMGNVGVNASDTESYQPGMIGDPGPRLAGFVVRSASPIPSSWRAEQSLEAYLEKHGVVGIREVDTRKLTRHLRDHGAQNAAIGSASPEELLRAAREAPDMNGLDLVERVTPKEPYKFDESRGVWGTPLAKDSKTSPHVVCMDFGMKRNILRCLVDEGFRVTALPAKTSARDVLGHKPDGIFLSERPGRPGRGRLRHRDHPRASRPETHLRDLPRPSAPRARARRKDVQAQVRPSRDEPPVKDLETGRIEITTQNHGFCVDLASLPSRIRSTHVHLNDETSEGLAAPDVRAFSVQYHPEAAAGPHDSLYLFNRFRDLISFGGAGGAKGRSPSLRPML